MIIQYNTPLKTFNLLPLRHCEIIKQMTKTVSLNDIYQVVNRLEDKTDKRMADIECRVDKIEDAQSKILGGLTIVSLFVGGAVTWIWDKIRGN